MDSVEISHRKFAKIVTVFFIIYHYVFFPHKNPFLLGKEKKNPNFQKLDIDLLPREFLFLSMVQLGEKRNW